MNGKTITLLGGAEVGDLRFNTESDVCYIENGVLRNKFDEFNPVTIEANVITFGEAEVGPILLDAYLKEAIAIECNPSLPRDDYQNVNIEFSEPVTIEDFMNHVRVTIASFEQTPFVATLRSIGSGQISVGDGTDEYSKFQGSGDDIHYTWSDLTSGHGPYLISIEWVN